MDDAEILAWLADMMRSEPLWRFEFQADFNTMGAEGPFYMVRAYPYDGRVGWVTGIAPLLPDACRHLRHAIEELETRAPLHGIAVEQVTP